jgi:hypothetical protein
VASITVEIPSLAESGGAFQFRREFLHRLRVAIGQAQIAGSIDAATTIELLKALPPPPADDPKS